MIKSINLNKTLLNTEFRKTKATKASERLLYILRSPHFREKILNMNRDIWLLGETSELKYESNEQIYKILMEGAEEWNNEVDYEIDLIVDDYKGKVWSSVVGYMNPGKPTVYVNTKFFDSMSIMKVCSNFGHEWFHTMGARHGGEFMRMSLAYYMNEVIESLYKEFYGRDSIEYEKVCTRKWYKLFIKTCSLKRK